MSTKINIKRTANEHLSNLADEVWEESKLWWSVYENMENNKIEPEHERHTAYHIYRTLQSQFEVLQALKHLANVTDMATPPWKK